MRLALFAKLILAERAVLVYAEYLTVFCSCEADFSALFYLICRDRRGTGGKNEEIIDF